MNRILFLPLDRTTLPYLIRTIKRGHRPFFMRRKIEAQKGFWSNLRVKGFFARSINLTRGNRDYKAWLPYWENYYKKHKINFVVTNIEPNLAVLAAVDKARELGITTCYLMHGEGDIYHFPQVIENWFKAGLYDYYYTRNNLTKDYLNTFHVGTEVRKFTRNKIDYSKTPIRWAKRKTILYAPMYAGFLDLNKFILSTTASHELRRNYNKVILDCFIESGHKILWCHDPALDYEPNDPAYYIHLKEAHKKGQIRWIKDKAKKYLKKADAAVMDVGSQFLFESMIEGKPVLCLYHKPTAPELKPNVGDVFRKCLFGFNNFVELREKLNEFLIEKQAWCYIPWQYVISELGQDDLIWEKDES